ncbi:uncharacterized protein LOC144048545 isoform X3 [Vanacampus margaritifer]
MLKKLVRKRLIAAADEIFGLFETTIASYEEQLCQAREETERQRQKLQAMEENERQRQKLQAMEENERQRQKLQAMEENERQRQKLQAMEENERQRQKLEAVCKAPILLRVQDGQQQIPRQEKKSPQADKETSTLERPQPFLKEEEEEADVSKLQLTVISVKSEDYKDESPESSPLHHHTEAPPDNLLAPLLDDDTEMHLGSNMNRARYDKQLKCSKEKTIFGKKKTSQLRKRFSCAFCGAHFTKNQHMLRHMRVHTGEKPFRCSVCGKMFSRKENVHTHMTTHTGEKPVGCLLCGKRFSHKSYLRVHMRTHTGEKPFSCSICGKRYSQRSSLTAHMRGHNMERTLVLQ